MWRKIIRFLFDFFDYIILLLLLLLSSMILLTNNSPQIRLLQGEIADVFRFIHYPGMWANQLSSLVDENRQLKQQNLRLSMQNVELKEAYLENSRLRKMLQFMDSTHFELLPAKVLNRGVAPTGSSILINVGQNQQVTPNKAVISTAGIIGKTIASGDETSVVQVFTDVNFRLSIKFQQSRVLGILSWNPAGYAEVGEIPRTAQIHPGETVITSGYSDIYPPNLAVGEVLEVRRSENELYQTALIRPLADINKTEEVFVILTF